MKVSVGLHTNGLALDLTVTSKDVITHSVLSGDSAATQQWLDNIADHARASLASYGLIAPPDPDLPPKEE